MRLLIALLCLWPLAAADYDLLIRNARVVDGTGNPWFRADVAIRNGRIAAIGRLADASAVRVIDAAGRVLAPGFIDIHTHVEDGIEKVPGADNYVMDGVTTVVTGMGITREWETGTMEQILVTPLSPAVFLFGKCLPFALIGFVDVAGLLTLGSYLFGVPLRGSFLVVGAGALLFLFSTLGTGIFISTISRSQQQAILGSFFFLMPAILLGGFLTPIENMPEWIRPLTYVNPVRYFLEILRGCLLKGSGFGDLGMQFGALALFGVSIMTLSVTRFRRRLG